MIDLALLNIELSTPDKHLHCGSGAICSPRFSTTIGNLWSLPFHNWFIMHEPF